MTTPSARERIESMDDFQVVRLFQHWSGGLCDGAITDDDAIVDGVPAEVASVPGFAAIADLTAEQADAGVRPADSVALARAMLEPLADTPEVGPTIATALESFHDDKLVVDAFWRSGWSPTSCSS